MAKSRFDTIQFLTQSSRNHLSFKFNLESTECQVSHETILSLGSFAIPLLNSGVLDDVTVTHSNQGGDGTLLEARVSLHQGSDHVKIVELKSSASTGTSCWKSNAENNPTVASISGVIPLQGGFVMNMDQLENDLHIWNSIHSFVLGHMQIEHIHKANVCYCLEDTRRGTLSASVSRAPEEIYHHLEHATTLAPAEGLCCSHGISDFIMQDSSGCCWGSIACLLSKSVDGSSQSVDASVSVFNSTLVHSSIVRMLSKCAWSRKGGFTFRSNSGGLPISITRRGKSEKGGCCCSISRIVLYIFPMPGDESRTARYKKQSITVVVRSALNNAIQKLQANLNTVQPQWAAKPGKEAATTLLVESLVKVLSRADGSSSASQRLLRAMKDMRVNTMEDVESKLRDMVSNFLRN